MHYSCTTIACIKKTTTNRVPHIKFILKIQKVLKQHNKQLLTKDQQLATLLNNMNAFSSHVINNINVALLAFLSP